MNRLSFGIDANHKLTIQFAIFGLVLLLVNVFLARQNKELKVLASRPDRALELRPGTALPPLEGVDSKGRQRALAYGQDSRKTVLFVFSPRCRACLENMSSWEAMITRLDPQSYRLAAVSLQSGGNNESLNRLGMDRIPVFTEIDPKFRVAYSLALTPQVILIDSAGKAEKVWTGTMRDEEILDVEKTLGIDLP